MSAFKFQGICSLVAVFALAACNSSAPAQKDYNTLGEADREAFRQCFTNALSENTAAESKAPQQPEAPAPTEAEWNAMTTTQQMQHVNAAMAQVVERLDKMEKRLVQAETECATKLGIDPKSLSAAP